MSMPMIRITVAAGLVLCAAAVFTVTAVGERSRFPAGETVPPGVGQAAILKNTSDVYFLWKQRGYFGNIVVHFGNYLHFIPVNSPLRTTHQLPSAGAMFTQMEAYENALSYRNYLWVAMQGNMVRRIYSVLPRETYLRKRQEIAEGMSDARLSERPMLQESEIEDAEMGLLRALSDTMPRIEEPVLVNIDASYLAAADMRTFADVLKRSGLRIRLLTFCLSEDSPDVSRTDRDRLRQFARALVADQFIEGLSAGDDPL